MGLVTQKRITITTVAQDIYDAIPSPCSIVVKNVGVVTVYLGDDAMTAADGFELAPGDILEDKRESGEELFALTASGTADLSILYDTRTV